MISVGQGALTNGAKSHSLHFSIAVGEHALDGADGVVSGELTEKHGAKPGPGIQCSHALVGTMLGDPALKFRTRNELDYLTKNCRLGHGLEILWERRWVFVNPF